MNSRYKYNSIFSLIFSDVVQSFQSYDIVDIQNDAVGYLTGLGLDDVSKASCFVDSHWAECIRGQDCDALAWTSGDGNCVKYVPRYGRALFDCRDEDSDRAWEWAGPMIFQGGLLMSHLKTNSKPDGTYKRYFFTTRRYFFTQLLLLHH